MDYRCVSTIFASQLQRKETTMSIENRELFRPSAAVATSAGVTTSGQSSALDLVQIAKATG
jgi:hypothetical protein